VTDSVSGYTLTLWQRTPWFTRHSRANGVKSTDARFKRYSSYGRPPLEEGIEHCIGITSMRRDDADAS
jgi:hypothetical protein